MPDSISDNSSHPLRIFVSLESTALNGLATATCASMEALRDQNGTSFTIASSNSPEGSLRDYAVFDPDIRSFPHQGKLNWRGITAFTSHVRTRAADCDLVWATGRTSSPVRAAYATGLPVVLSIHSQHGPDRRHNLRWKLFYEIFGHRIEHFFYVSSFTRSQAIMLCPWIEAKSSVSLQHLPLHYIGEEARHKARSEARRVLGLPADAWIVGSSGRLTAGKRFDVFLDTAAKVATEIPESYFIICGDGDMKPALVARAKSLGLEKRVLFTGWTADINDYNMAWDVLLFSSDFESAGRTALEAMSHGTPVVASVPHGGTADIISSPLRGFYNPTHDANAMAAQILRLRKDYLLRRRMVETAATYIGNEYSAESHAKILMAAFEPLAEKSRLRNAK